MRATTGAPDCPCPSKVTKLAVEAGLERLQADPSDWIATLCAVSVSPGDSTPAETRLQRKGLMFDPQVTLNEIGTPGVMLISPADAITTAVVNADMSNPLIERHVASCLRYRGLERSAGQFAAGSAPR